MSKKKQIEVHGLFYITHKDNVASILRHGILSHTLVLAQNVAYKPIYDNNIVNNRKNKITSTGAGLWDFANVYFQARNPMMYRVSHEVKVEDLAVIGLKNTLLDISNILITDGNAASAPTSFYDKQAGMNMLKENWSIINAEWWNSTDGSKRKIMSECLVPHKISPEYIHSIFVPNHKAADLLRDLVGCKIDVIPEPNLFFLPARRIRVTPNLSLAEGDMFFSNMQTITVSVNVVGVMGKGLASRTKYQFPDVYVIYQDACRRKTLRMGTPYLYKREASFDEELVDEPTTSHQDDIKWFLLFATKKHWRQDSDLQGIIQGLDWVIENAADLKIKSLAMPALGCGLGKLDWKDVGPEMCTRLSKLNIPVSIYLPREHDIPDEYLKTSYLLR